MISMEEVMSFVKKNMVALELSLVELSHKSGKDARYKN